MGKGTGFEIYFANVVRELRGKRIADLLTRFPVAPSCGLFSVLIGGECWQSAATLERGATSNLWGVLDRIRGHMNSWEETDGQDKSELASQHAESEDEARRLRRLQIMMGMVSSVISQDSSLTVEEASELAAGAKRAALAMFPDKELAYDLLYKPRLQRLMRERFHLQ